MLPGSRNVGNVGHKQYRARNVLIWQEEHHVERRGQALRWGEGKKREPNEMGWVEEQAQCEDEAVSDNTYCGMSKNRSNNPSALDYYSFPRFHVVIIYVTLVTHLSTLLMFTALPLSLGRPWLHLH